MSTPGPNSMATSAKVLNKLFVYTAQIVKLSTSNICSTCSQLAAMPQLLHRKLPLSNNIGCRNRPSTTTDKPAAAAAAAAAPSACVAVARQPALQLPWQHHYRCLRLLRARHCCPCLRQSAPVRCWVLLESPLLLLMHCLCQCWLDLPDEVPLAGRVEGIVHLLVGRHHASHVLNRVLHNKQGTGAHDRVSVRLVPGVEGSCE